MPIRVHVNVNLKNVSERAHAKCAIAVEKAAYDIEAHAKAMAPVDTGFLRAAIQAESSQGKAVGNRLQRAGASTDFINFAVGGAGGLRWEVTSYASYSAYLEFGTRKMAAQPYMTPAAELVRPQLRRAIAMSVV